MTLWEYFSERERFATSWKTHLITPKLFESQRQQWLSPGDSRKSCRQRPATLLAQHSCISLSLGLPQTSHWTKHRHWQRKTHHTKTGGKKEWPQKISSQAKRTNYIKLTRSNNANLKGQQFHTISNDSNTTIWSCSWFVTQTNAILPTPLVGPLLRCSWYFTPLGKTNTILLSVILV